MTLARPWVLRVVAVTLMLVPFTAVRGEAVRSVARPSSDATGLRTLGLQEGDNDCGPAAVRFVLHALGYDAAATRWSVELLGGERAWSMSELAEDLELAGFRVEVTRHASLRAQWGILYFGDAQGLGHFVAARLLDTDRVQLFDPGSGALVAGPVETFGRGWSGLALHWVHGP